MLRSAVSAVLHAGVRRAGTDGPWAAGALALNECLGSALCPIYRSHLFDAARTARAEQLARLDPGPGFRSRAMSPEQRCHPPICLSRSTLLTMDDGVDLGELQPFYTATKPLCVWLNQANFRYKVELYRTKYHWTRDQVKR